MTDHKFVSVTTVLSVLDKPALPPWAANAVADNFIADPQYWAQEAIRDPHECRTRLAASRFKPPAGSTRTATQLGTDIHDLAERWAIDGIRPIWDEQDEIHPYMCQYGRFLDLYQPTYQAAEMTVYNLDYRYAGTCDGIMTINGVRYIVDYKTSRKSVDAKGKQTRPYPEAAAQLAAYRYADLVAIWTPRKEEAWSSRWYFASDEELAAVAADPDLRSVPEVDLGLVIHITTEHCHPHPTPADERYFNYFLSILDVWEAQQALNKQAIGPVLDPPGTTLITRSSR